MNQICVCGLINHPNNPDLYLAVSRKNNPNDFGLFGGKYEKNLDGFNYKNTAIREALEETGYDIIVFDESFIDIDSENIVITYLGKSDTTNPKQVLEEGIVKWCTKEELIKGSFGIYNEKMFKHFNL